ncbi:MAG: MBL fold metallo-hydrolase [Ruminococcaceae bacterium]|jgi:glyoxylase-like metal-dependent hydrolase (beta-lactamase superfamily II)|nr:MBL fold metallo-hydrolase [Oscillospiraceae bacterium]
MELRQVLGNTYAAVGFNALIGIYRINKRDIVLLDTGLGREDRQGLTELIEQNGFVPRGIICTHCHWDHTGNAAYLRRRYSSPIAAQLIEAGIGARPESYRANYVAMTYAQAQVRFEEDSFSTDVIIGVTDDRLTFCGADFGVLQLPGHSAGQIGIITPDNVAYLADGLIGPALLASAKLPTSMSVRTDLATKESLRSLHCDAYILAHKDVCTDIGELIDRNIAFYQEKAQNVLSCLAAEMTLSQWLAAFSRKAGFRTKSSFKLGIIRRNFYGMVSYLEDTGQVAVRWEDCVKHYSPVTGD